MKIRNFTLCSLLVFLFLVLNSCSSDDDSNEVVYNPCEDFSQIEEVTISDVGLSIEQDGNSYYYVINAAILNNTEEKVFGETVFVVSIFDDKVLLGSLNCYMILSKDTCYLNYYGMIPEGAEIDWDFSMECIYFVLD